jgi:uncharacterized protein
MSQFILDEPFETAALPSNLHWFNSPARWGVEPCRSVLVVEPEAGTDFWQRTHYGFCADNGHFLGLEVPGDFTLATQVSFYPVHQYDQAGLMIRANESCWIKTSVEHEPGAAPALGVVVTNRGFSDWSMQDLPRAQNTIGLRLTKRGSDVMAEFDFPGQNGWKVMRMAHWEPAVPGIVQCGLYACSPKGAGFRAEFEFLRVSPD